MMVIVNDANILIDLLKMDLLETFFRLPFEFHVTDLAAGEILEENVDQLHGCISDGIILKRSFTFEELQDISAVQDTHPGLSLADCSCVFLSTSLSATLLTGDAVLRRAAERTGIAVHGVLWVFQELVAHAILPRPMACQILTRLMAINPRLPLRECRKLMDLWR